MTSSPESTATDDGATETDGATDDDGAGFGALVALAAIGAALLAMRRRR